MMNFIYDTTSRLKTCGRCKKTKSFDDFHVRRNPRASHPFQSYCKQCSTENARVYRHNNNVIYDQVGRNLKWYTDLKEQPCSDCGAMNPYYCNDWDHKESKVDCVSKLVRTNRPKEEILAEISKCDLVCATCHRKRTARRIVERRKLLAEEELSKLLLM